MKRGRPRKTATDLGSLDGLVTILKNLERERDEALAMIDKLRRLLNA